MLINFSQEVTPNEFAAHVKASFDNGISIIVGRLESIGGGQVAVYDSAGNNFANFRGLDDTQFKYEDQSSGHGPKLYNIEWVV